MREAMLSCKKAPTAPSFAEAAETYSDALQFYRTLAEGMDQVPVAPSPGYSNATLLAALKSLDSILAALAQDIAALISRTNNALNFAAGVNFGKNAYASVATLGTLTRAIIAVGATLPKVASGSMGDRLIEFNSSFRHQVPSAVFGRTVAGAPIPMTVDIAVGATLTLTFPSGGTTYVCMTTDNPVAFAGVNAVYTERATTGASAMYPSGIAGSTVTVNNNGGNVASLNYYAINYPTASFPAPPTVQVLPPAAWLSESSFANLVLGPEQNLAPTTVQDSLAVLTPTDYVNTSLTITRYINFEFLLQYYQ